MDNTRYLNKRTRCLVVLRKLSEPLPRALRASKVSKERKYRPMAWHNQKLKRQLQARQQLACLFLGIVISPEWNWLALDVAIICVIIKVVLIISQHRLSIRLRLNNKSSLCQAPQIIIIGFRPLIIKMLDYYRSSQRTDRTIHGYLATPFDSMPSDSGGASLACLGGIDCLDQCLINRPASEVWICLPANEVIFLKSLIKHLQLYPIQIKWIPDFSSARSGQLTEEEEGGLAVFDVQPAKMMNHHSGSWGKSLMDRTVALIVLLIIWPVMLLIAVIIKLTSPGPILFKQIRHGKGGKPFVVYKYRTMYVQSCDEDYPHQAKRNDPRVTRVGAFLRRNSLDELPQLFNVLQGTMSIVGPRPHAIEHNLYYCTRIPNYMVRHTVKPGITGWAQIHGYRGETSDVSAMKIRIQYDLDYIKSCSLLMDLKIIALTILRIYQQETAY